MKNRGRPSAVSLEIIQGGAGPLEVFKRPPPPSYLSAEEAQEWVSVCNACEADWFGREMHALLAQYCHHAVEFRYAAALARSIREREDFSINEWDKAKQIAERESRAASSLATRMRLTQSTSWDAKKKRHKPTAQRNPWD